jgi:uncharacterized protein (DUF58 family)
LNFARLNHILIPGTKEGRDRIRQRWYARLFFEPLTRIYLSFSEEGRFLVVFTVLAGLAGLNVARSQNHLLWSLLLSVLVSSLLVRRLFALRRVRIHVAGPARVMAGEHAQFIVTLENKGTGTHRSLRVDRPFLPWDGSWAGPRPSIPLLGPAERRSVMTAARFVARGPHHLDSFAAEALVPLRLALGPRIVSSGTRLTVVPRIASVVQVHLPTSPRYQPGGVAMASVTGESSELVGVRPYRAGDRIRDLHAKTWARTGEPVVRKYQQEYFSRVGVILDTDLPGRDEETLEAAVSLAAGIVANLSRGEALIDLLVTGDRLHPLTVGRSLGHLDQVLDHLACVEAGPRFDAARLMYLLRPHLCRLSSIVAVFLGWDDERTALVQQIERAGPGCRALLVRGSRGTPPDEPSHATTAISVEDIRRACESRGRLAL